MLLHTTELNLVGVQTCSSFANVGHGMHRQGLGAQVVRPDARAVWLALEWEHSLEVVVEAARNYCCPGHARRLQVLLYQQSEGRTSCVPGEQRL